jgi:outer membrane murein-binding lipoprotein Lpp
MRPTPTHGIVDPMNAPTRIAVDAVLRGGVLLAGLWAFSKIWDASTPGPHGTDIGGGLAGIGLVVLAALVWGAIDGRRHEPGRLALTWIGAGLVMGACVDVLIAAQGGQRGEVLFAMVALPVFLTAAVAAPSVLAGTVSSAVGHRHRPS